LEVNDPRGRYVKTIKFYYMPRPMSSTCALKSEEYTGLWQSCGTIDLPRGSVRASYTLAVPIVAANLKIEYTDFYERPGGSKATDGSLLVHCPRCTRVVNNAHGVCGNCGEVVFQCRKCRHINYDRLDAFLCVECGYCASGTFSFEMTAGIASNAVAITNDQDLERSTQMLAVASRLHDDLRSTLKEKLTALTRSKKKATAEDETGFHSPGLRQAYAKGLLLPFGEKDEDVVLSLDKLGKQGSVVKAVARPENRSSTGGSVAGDRTRSLLRLARQWRSDSSPERRRSGEVVIRHLGRDLQIDDDDSELFGLLEGTGNLARVAGLDPSDPLSRLLASVQNRRDQRTAAEGDGSGRQEGEGAPASGDAQAQKSKPQSNTQDLHLCERLHLLMREAERESYLLLRRILAWRRLEQGTLVEVGSDFTRLSMQFTPSHCSNCAGTLALQFLLLWLRIFQTDPKNVVVTKEMIHSLLQDDTTVSKSLQDCRRDAVKEIALQSESGAPIVVEALRMRLMASHDVNCAEILGKILEASGEGPSSKPFVELAVEILEATQASSLL
jgi:hypothetical protein